MECCGMLWKLHNGANNIEYHVCANHEVTWLSDLEPRDKMSNSEWATWHRLLPVRFDHRSLARRQAASHQYFRGGCFVRGLSCDVHT